MFRLRRYRVFVVCAFVVTFLLYHVAQNSQWERPQPVPFDHGDPNNKLKPKPKPKHGHTDEAHEPQSPVAGHGGTVAQPTPKKEQTIKIPQLKTSNEIKGGYGLPTSAPTGLKAPQHATSTDAAAGTSTTATAQLPDGKLEKSHDTYNKGDTKVHEDGVVPASSTTIHWQKPTEWFPVSELILLPTGSPKPIHSVQFAFTEELPAAREKRELRLAKVKSEATRAWSGYKKFAWTHDELMPVSKGAKDPFCGWAATLVDSLDTLWIMGLKDEFDAAVEAVKTIDFTTSPRDDIPVFETVIRYLGGLLGAYDVSGGRKGGYNVLLDKAVELAEILMGVFDTPNRMPILYYHWSPAYHTSPKRASVRSGVAEMGSLCMEFTRLAQLTGESKYYDAVARITNALDELQNREGATALPGIFPENLDASGCNKTATAMLTLDTSSTAAQEQADSASDLLDPPTGYKPSSARTNTSSTGSGTDLAADFEFQVSPGSQADGSAIPVAPELGKRAEGGVSGNLERNAAQQALQKQHEKLRENPAPISAQGLPVDWECVPQNLTAAGNGWESYSMGGSQDSTYEYFPKQFVLLGGLEPKYQAMYKKNVDAVKKYLLFRPMAEGDPDVLFAAKAFSSDGTDKNLTFQYEVTHLSCFLGGMFGLGGKIFGNPEDVEIGKKLAAGCVWAYDSMPTGVMPEYSMVLPCADIKNCHWNKTTWYAHLDRQAEYRTEQMSAYLEQKSEWEKKVHDIKTQDAARQASDKQEAARLAAEKQERQQEAKRKASDEAEGEGADTGPKGGDGPSTPAHKRDLSTESKVDDISNISEGAATKKINAAQQPLSGSGSGDDQKPVIDLDLPQEPVKPQTHEEYVAQLIETSHLPPGFIDLKDERYILRPEAIESVWYMYRITGDSSWQEIGWRMFEAIIKLTQTDVGHSAVNGVASTEAAAKADSMESFWLAETLKYFYLLFATPDTISLDEWVLNTEAHPFKRPS
ncbi:glycosyl hydrolase family 47-domain-containing protein [Lasiosphaeria ovina]|uniref:alpha-1,2-Mannosidase n=1 Tax=Lasiosphaeria ovina TaxID=92902 RepID=A0AAE0KJ30_9PEZI|nr:glycosyl hydrolase family 47-domain-containing protein [Lasiosphaeria ovina]